MDVSSFALIAQNILEKAQQWPGTSIAAGSLGYLLLVASLRYRRRDRLQREFNYPTRESMANMTDDDAFKIQDQLSKHEFPFTYLKALQFALFRTYGITTISKLLVKTSEFSNAQTSMKRYADTGVLITEFASNPPTSARAHEGIARMNYLHKGYRASGKILDDDMLYTLSLFALEPIRWIERYEWRKLTELEKCSFGTFWKSVGDAMEISYEQLPSGKGGFRDGIQWLEEIAEWSEAYEEKAMVPHQCNKETADQTVQVLLYDTPVLFRGVMLNLVYFLMDDRLRKAMMYPEPNWLMARLISASFAARKLILRYFFLPRPRFLAAIRVDSNPSAEARHHAAEWEGAPYYIKPTFMHRWGPRAWFTWLRGLPVPGDEGDTYSPQGYYIADVGPKKFEGKGREQIKLTRERLKRERRGQCPFAIN